MTDYNQIYTEAIYEQSVTQVFWKNPLLNVCYRDLFIFNTINLQCKDLSLLSMYFIAFRWLITKIYHNELYDLYLGFKWYKTTWFVYIWCLWLIDIKCHLGFFIFKVMVFTWQILFSYFVVKNTFEHPLVEFLCKISYKGKQKCKIYFISSITPPAFRIWKINRPLTEQQL